MRVLEPHHLRRPSPKHKQLPFRKRLKLTGFAVVALACGYLLLGQGVDRASRSERGGGQSEVTVASQPKVLKQFTAEQFKAAYSSYIYPNTQLITAPPEITGNEAADARIRGVAVAQGYKLTALPVASIVKTNEPGLEGDDLIQPNALIAWQALKAEAANEGVNLRLTSAYRSIAYQRSLFLRRMQAAGVNVGRVLEGYADDELEAVLSRAALPGYSRHHTGYTIDLSCDGIGLEAFISTSCYKWLSNSNFEKVKKHGWVPSYPEGVGGLGPEPESWEYVWVGKNSTYE